MCTCDLYIPPVEYLPNIDNNHYNRKYAQEVVNVCQTILNKEAYYVASNNELQGYRWINFPMRIWIAVINWWTDGRIEAETAQKITDAFNFILNINTQKPLMVDDQKGTLLYNTHYRPSIEHFNRYTSLADKVIKKYSKNQYPKLYELA